MIDPCDYAEYIDQKGQIQLSDKTYRDWIAQTALAAELQKERNPTELYGQNEVGKMYRNALATFCYAMADDMIKAKEAKQ